ncbi:MAG: beta-propeller domain-containing protein [Clostridia bacterium]|nr:beta-propeller domain-containing protein [Clostridia bacterium]
MKKSDKQIMDMLEKELKESVQTADIPLRLQKESMVAMLRDAEKTETDFSDKTGTATKSKSGNVIILRRLMATAAMLALVVTGTLLMRTGDGVKVVKTDSFYEGYKSANPVINAESYEEVEKAVEEILEGKTESRPAEKTTKKSDNAGNPGKAPEATSAQGKDSLLEGYGEYVAIANGIVGGIIDAAEKKHAVNEPDGVATYGDFKPDIVKNDGRYLYITSTGINSVTGAAVERIKIVKTVYGGGLEDVSEIILSSSESKGNFDECIEIYLKNNCLTAIMKRHEYSVADSVFYDNASTVAVSYDITNPYAPKKIREHIQDGEYVSSNLYENRLCLVTAKTLPDNAGSRELIPGFSVDGVEKKLRAEEIFIAVNDPEASYLFVTVTDIADFSKDVGCLAVLGCGNEIYCSSCAIAVAREFVSLEADENNNHSSLTEIYRFNINDTAIDLSGSYIVQGSLSGGVSVDEKSGYLRAITTDSSASYVYVLDEKMAFVSGLKDIFPGEKISSVKFIGSNGYVIVDGEADKTMIIDFSQPAMPEVAGTIEEKAFSDDLYAISEKLLLGMSEDEDGLVTLTLFDVSDPSAPVTAAVYSLEESCRPVSSSDSRSVMLASEEELFGIPVLKSDVENGTEISAYVIFDVSDGKIVPLGTYNHDLSYIGDAAVRGTFIEDILYTVSGEKIVSFDIISEAGKLTEFPLN